MSLGLNDLKASILLVAESGIFYAYHSGVKIPYLGILSNARVVSLVLLILGMAICASGAGENIWPVPKDNLLIMFMAALGFLSLFIGIAGIITGNKTVVTVFMGATVALWVMTTLRHLLS